MVGNAILKSKHLTNIRIIINPDSSAPRKLLERHPFEVLEYPPPTWALPLPFPTSSVTHLPTQPNLSTQANPTQPLHPPKLRTQPKHHPSNTHKPSPHAYSPPHPDSAHVACRRRIYIGVAEATSACYTVAWRGGSRAVEGAEMDRGSSVRAYKCERGGGE
ncbi:hypothetical protein AB1N83_010573 [Pleurotus pulmonarius]